MEGGGAGEGVGVGVGVEVCGVERVRLAFAGCCGAVLFLDGGR